ncbi:hypothetical protein BBJ29_006817 [Phytophthora kernoviae]|uniref:Peptidase S9 prolyl oligopeptidase catalytic domain-containing protein n=1 Tax=Phytophthora kernoviae TaxID=325452 RepID=A0A3F2RFI5_9STRA|nr:hypothetical protein BBP00_00008372 [Phytophthora kernoviae]RLN61926.1 hypothetical protein BBJ29_006817 [Phytophthora kernoviae]
MAGTREVIPLEDVAKMPAPGLSSPANVSFSPDGRIVAFLHASGAQNGLSRQLYALDVATRRVALLAAPPNKGNTEGNLSLEEKLRRERQRQMGVGITSYAWSPSLHSQRLLYPLQGDLYVQEKPGDELQLLFDKTSTGAAGGAIDPQFSPDGRYVAFVQDKELYVMSSHVPTNGKQQVVQVTSGAREVDGKSNGLACFLTQEELSRFRGFWWSPDSSSLAFEEVDDSHIPKFRIMHSGSATPTGDAAQEDHRYPFAGAANPKRRLGVIQLPRGLVDHGLHFSGQSRQLEIPTPVWMDFANSDTDFYIARVNWLPDQSLGVQRLNRLQTEVTFLRFDPLTGRATTLIQESSPVWINANYLFRAIEAESNNSFRFLWGSERTEFMHIYLYEYTAGASAATLLGAVTTGNWSVESVEGIDLANDLVYICGTADSPLERHLYVAPIIPMTATPLHPKRLTGAEAQGKLCVPKIISVPTRDGHDTLYGAVYLPDPEIHGPGPYPTIVSVYGGPHVQRVARMWAMTVDMRVQRFRDMGYAVLKVDNRGSFRRGSAFEGAIKHHMGTVEIQDQEDAVQQLVQDGITIEGRVGIYGWSYGGYMSAISLMKAPNTFKLAIAGAPVTSWDGYDTCYTERYMSTPQLNPQGYREGSVMESVSNMKKGQKLMLIHGLIDENVHFRHTARLITSLINARKHYDLLLFPGERHSPRHLEDRIYMEQRIAEYVEANL